METLTLFSHVVRELHLSLLAFGPGPEYTGHAVEDLCPGLMKGRKNTPTGGGGDVIDWTHQQTSNKNYV